ncbi:ecotin [Shewanella sp. Choline-02u-19]|jgi:ecotin|uniref:serine protease inhibitor ecotin n=1 Tax=unclassified Shewanella TaxID=196818 RepID=UPI000C33FD69|nr:MULTISPECIES: serine protease inhibitor ecotin [unclassified Shewanella]PKG74298.1 ecotin [Shewanella sp. GutCb]PKH55951.1 ecotin [Shewanella sp. Bg11-22]PKI27397.1 ecotin [Shewanella sp. Choline-02u-19]
MIFNLLTNKQIRSFTLTSGLLLSVCTFSANATSPKHPSGENEQMVNAQTYSASNYVSQENSKMFPAPKEGQVQHILTLKTLENEADYMLEIQIGQTKMVDCNKHGLSGKVIQKSVQGWGFSYYEVESISAGPSTMMACFDQALTEKFLPITTDLKMRYDSRLPKVIYLPENSQVRYRIWKVESPFSYSGDKQK